MTAAPFVSTLIAAVLVPVAFLYVHAFVSGLRRGRLHPVTGTLAIVWDLSVSIGYMLYRSIGGAVEGESLQLTGSLPLYFMVHGTVALVVILLELAVLGLGIMKLRGMRGGRWHGRLAKVLFVVWWFAFLSGEVFYLVMYVL